MEEDLGRRRRGVDQKVRKSDGKRMQCKDVDEHHRCYSEDGDSPVSYAGKTVEGKTFREACISDWHTPEAVECSRCSGVRPHRCTQRG